VTDPRAPYSAGFPATTTGRRYLSPTERLRLREARMQAAERGLDKCVSEVRARILRGLHVRERGGFATIEALVPDPDAVAAALEDAGFKVHAQGMLIVARRPLRARKGRACEEAR
jgi:hypothetical protein